MSEGPSQLLLGVLAVHALREARWRREAAALARARLEQQAQAAGPAPLPPGLPPAATITARDGSLSFGVPQGLAPLPADMLAQFEQMAGPTLATAADVTPSGIPMLFSVSRGPAVGADVERAFWRLGHDLDHICRDAARRTGLAMTHGPAAARIGGEQAIWFAVTWEQHGESVRTWQALVLASSVAFDLTMNVKPEMESSYLGAWWTILNSWSWRRP